MFKTICASTVSRFRFKQQIFLLAVVLSLFAGVSAQNGPDAADEIRAMPADFKSDGCTLFPDGNYCDCCVKHDEAYYFGGTEKERRRADVRLYKCVKAKKGFQHKIIAPLMYVGVRIGGVRWLPTPFRWGFGKSRQRKKEAERVPPSQTAVNKEKKD